MSSDHSHPTNLSTRLVNTLRSILQIILWPLIRLSRFIILPLRGGGGSLYGGGDGEYDGLSAAVTAKASQQFVAYLRGLYHVAPLGGGNGGGASTTNAWLTTGFTAAQEQATQQQSLLLVYLHSPLHRSSESFCKNVLCHETMANFINQDKIIAFGVSIHTAQGGYLAQVLQASAYPFLALLQPKVTIAGAAAATATAESNSNSNNNITTGATAAATTMTLLLRAEGPALTELSVQQILPHFQTCLQRHQLVVAEAEARRSQRQEESDLRRQQDEEYQAALLADQERERQQIEAQELEKQRLLQQAVAEQEAKDRKAAVLQQARAAVPEEPPPLTGAVTTTTTTIRFVLPSGTKLNRRFFSQDTIAGVLAYLTIYVHDNDIPMSSNIGLSTNFPKKSYHDDPTLTLEEAGLVPQAVLMVQDLDA